MAIITRRGSGNDFNLRLSWMTGRFSLFDRIVLDEVECLNERNAESGRSVLKEWSLRNDTTATVESSSADNQQLLFKIPFTGPVRLYSVVVTGGDEGTSPREMLLFKDRSYITLKMLGNPNDQIKMRNIGTMTEYPVKLNQGNIIRLDLSAQLSHVHIGDGFVPQQPDSSLLRTNMLSHLSIFFPCNFTKDKSTKIRYIGLMGDYVGHPSEHKYSVLPNDFRTPVRPSTLPSSLVRDLAHQAYHSASIRVPMPPSSYSDPVYPSLSASTLFEDPIHLLPSSDPVYPSPSPTSLFRDPTRLSARPAPIRDPTRSSSRLDSVRDSMSLPSHSSHIRDPTHLSSHSAAPGDLTYRSSSRLDTFRDPTRLSSRPAPIRDSTRLSSRLAPYRDPSPPSSTRSAPFRDPTRLSTRSAPFRDPTRLSSRPAPVRDPTRRSSRLSPDRDPTRPSSNR